MARRPQNWHGVIGQRRLVSLLLKYANGSRRRGTTFPNIGIYGPAGMGKSLFIRALVAELGVDLHFIDASGKPDEEDVLEKLEQAKAGDVVHIDEAHALSQAMQTRLLSPVGEERKIHRNQVAFSEGTGISVADFCLAISTTNPGQLIKPLRSRLKLNITLDLYSLSEIREIIGRICENQRLRLSTQAITLLAQASRGNPRRAGQFGRLMSDYYADMDEELSKNRVAAYLEHHGVDLKTMLDNLEQQYLCALLNQGQSRIALSSRRNSDRWRPALFAQPVRARLDSRRLCRGRRARSAAHGKGQRDCARAGCKACSARRRQYRNGCRGG